MAQVKYVGQYDVVEIKATGQLVAQGAVVEVDDALAASLGEQAENWQVITAAKPKTEKVPPADPPADEQAGG